MENKGYSRQGFFGDIHHYDEHGHKARHGVPGMFGGYNHSSSDEYNVNNKQTQL